MNASKFIMDQNLKEIRTNLEKTYEVRDRPKGGYYVFGDEKEIIQKVKGLLEIAAIDSGTPIVAFNYSTFCRKDNSVVAGVALFI